MCRIMWRLSFLILFSCFDLSLNLFIQERVVRAQVPTSTFVTDIEPVLQLCGVPAICNIWDPTSTVYRSCDVKIPFKYNVSDIKFDFEYDIFLCTALSEYSQTVCNQNRLNKLSNFSSLVVPVASKFCRNSSNTLVHNPVAVIRPEAKPFMESYSMNIGNETRCERVCVTGKTINPLCESIYKLNLILQYYVSVSPKGVNMVGENPSSGNQHLSQTSATGSKVNSPNEHASAVQPKNLQHRTSGHNNENNTKQVPIPHNNGQTQMAQIPKTDTHKLDPNVQQLTSQGLANENSIPKQKETEVGSDNGDVGDTSVVELGGPAENLQQTAPNVVNVDAPSQAVSENQGEGITPVEAQIPLAEIARPNGDARQGVDNGQITANIPPEPSGQASNGVNNELSMLNNPLAVTGDKSELVQGNKHGTKNNQAALVSENTNQVGSNSLQSPGTNNKSVPVKNSAQPVKNTAISLPEHDNAAPDTDQKTSNLLTDSSLSGPVVDTKKGTSVGIPKPVRPENKVSAGNIPVEDQTLQRQDSFETDITGGTSENKNEGTGKEDIAAPGEFSDEYKDDNDPTSKLDPGNSDSTQLQSNIAQKDPGNSDSTQLQSNIAQKAPGSSGPKQPQSKPSNGDAAKSGSTLPHLSSNVAQGVGLNANAAEIEYIKTEDSHFFAYFTTMIVLCVIGYLVFHNKQKILALALEGRSRRNTRRRPNTAGYRKLDTNLEEAVTSTCSSSSVTHVIY